MHTEFIEYKFLLIEFIEYIEFTEFHFISILMLWNTVSEVKYEVDDKTVTLEPHHCLRPDYNFQLHLRRGYNFKSIAKLPLNEITVPSNCRVGDDT